MREVEQDVLMFAAQRQYCEFSGRNATDLASAEQEQCGTHQHFTGHFWS